MNTKDDELRREQRADGKNMAKSRDYMYLYRLYIMTGKHSRGRRGRRRRGFTRCGLNMQCKLILRCRRQHCVTNASHPQA